jgi:polysaccharide biosynthesis transport protein
MASSNLNINYVFGIIRRRSPLFLIPFVLIASLGAIAVMSLPAVYSASAKILVESQQIPEELVKSTVTALASERIQVIQQRVLTRQNLLTVVDKFSLFASKPGISRTDVVDLMRERIVFTPVELQQVSGGRRNEKTTTAFIVEFSYENPDIALKVTNELLKFIVEEDIKSRNDRASDTSKFLERETQRISSELSLVQNEISEFKLQNSETLPEKLSFNMSFLERTERSIVELQRELNSNDEQQRLVKLEASVVNSIPGAVALDPLEAVKNKLNETRIEYELKKATLAPSHPDMRALKQSISSLEAQIDSAPALGVEGLSAKSTAVAALAEEKLLSLEQTRKLLLEQKAKQEEDAKKLRSVVVKTPEIGATLAVLERQEAALQKSLDDISQRYRQARLGERLEQDQRAEKFEVIEQPILPQSPSKPNRPALLGAVAAAALGVGAALSTATELLDQTIRSATDIERKLNQRPLVVIPYIRTIDEVRRNRWRKIGLVFVLIIMICAALSIIHNYIRPLDELLYKVAARLPF